MDFLSTFYLWLLPLSSLPLIIHLFFNRKYRTIEYSSIEFLKILKVDSMKRIKIVEILLLILRTLIILFIILMLSRPVVHGSFSKSISSSNPVFCLIAIDDSFSMTRSNNTVKILDFYKQDVSKIISTLPVNSKIEIISLSDTMKIYQGLSQSFSISSLNGQMKQSASSLSLLNHYMDTKKDEFNKELHLLSDLDASLFLTQKKQITNEWNVFIHDIDEVETNISILNAKILNEIPTINEELEIEVTVQNTSLNDIKNSLLILNINNVNVGQLQFDLMPKETQEFTFKTVLSSSGEYSCVFEVIHDKYFGDNSYYFPININSNFKIGVLGNVSEQYYFLENALKALKTKNPNLSYAFENELKNNQNTLVNNDINFIYGFNYIDENNLAPAIIDNFNLGGHNYIFPASDSYKANKFSDFWDYLSINLGEAKLTNYNNTTSYELSEKNIYNKNIKDILSIKDTDETIMQMHKYFIFNDSKNPMIAVNGKSIWEKFNNGQGQINLLGFNLDLEWTDFPVQASYISFIDRIINSSLNHKPMNLYVGDLIVRDNNYKEIKDPSGKVFKYINSKEDYRILQSGLHNIIKKESATNFYANIPLSELKRKKIDEKDLVKYIQRYILIPQNADLGKITNEARIGVELWKIFLYLAIMLLIIEMVISNQFFRRI